MDITFIEKLGQSGDSLWYTAYATSGHTQWRARIKRNFYAQQCYAVVERWDGSAWQEAYRVMDFKSLKIYSHSTNAKVETWITDATADAQTMLSTAQKVTGSWA